MESRTKNETVQTIFRAARNFFLKDGYNKTTIRKIAEQTGISIGLVIYHFSAKRKIAVQIILEQLGVFQDIIAEYADLEEDPMLFVAILIRLNRHIWWNWYRDFYLETLASDIYTEAIETSGMRNSTILAKSLDLDASEDYINFYFNYLPVSMERSLTLGKEHGYLQTIDDDDIPDFILHTTLDRFARNEKQVEQTCQKARKIVDTILYENFSGLSGDRPIAVAAGYVATVYPHTKRK